MRSELEANDRLPEYVGTLVPSEMDRQTVRSRKQAITDALKSEDVDVLSVSEAGSFAHGTGVRGHVDVDLMVWTRLAQKTTLPSSTLTTFKAALMRHWAITAATVSNPVVAVSFGSEPVFEVAPAFFSRKSGDDVVFEIGGRSDRWVESAPSVHKRYVNEQNDRLSKKLKGLIRLLKMWKYHNSVPVSSFYLEMRAAKYASQEQSILYRIDLPAVLRSILRSEAADMNDPTGVVSGRIPACSSEANRASVRAKLRSAIASLESAEQHRKAGDSVNYWLRMTDLFGSDFPLT